MKATTIKTPIEISIPFGEVSDHGLTLVHELGGKPRNYLHEVSVCGSPVEAVNCMIDAGYSRDFGYFKNGSQFWCWRKAYSLQVAAW